jgi:hypothetical protein
MQKVDKKNVLVVLSIMGQFPEMFRLVKLLKSSTKYNPIIYFNLGADLSHKNVKHCLNEGIDVLHFDHGYIEADPENLKKIEHLNHKTSIIDKPETPEIPPVYADKIGFKRYIKLNYPLIFNFLKWVYFLRYKLQLPSLLIRLILMRRRERIEAQFFQQLNVKLLILAEDSVDYFTPSLIRLGHRCNVKTVIFPYTFANQYEFLEDAFFNDRRVNRTFLNFLTGHFFPKWTYRYKGKKLIKSEPSLILATEFFRLAPPNPWVMSSGFSDAIAVESSFMKDYYVKAGLPTRKIVETGHPSLDPIYEIYKNREIHRRKLITDLGLDRAKPIVLCSMPPTQWPRPAYGFQTYPDFLKAFLVFLNEVTEVNVIFKFHPRIDFAEIDQISRDYNIKYSLNDTAELVAISDMYVASVSSTIRWALALGLPTINYDVYNYKYGDFDGAGDFQTVFNIDDFKKVFLTQVKNLKSKELGQTSFQSHYSLLDGKAGQRILSLFEELIDPS